jgi:tetratricopeptide (TPR) repeat protein
LFFWHLHALDPDPETATDFAVRQQPPPRNSQAASAHAFQRATQMQWQGKLDQAETLYRAILAKQPDHSNAAHDLGILRFHQGRYAEALTHIGASLKAKPKDAVALMTLGLVQAKLGRPAEALASFDKAIAVKPGYVWAHNNRGNSLRDLKRPEEALASYDKALALEPDHAEAHYNRGNALGDLGRPQEALASYDKALALRPDHAEAHYNRGNALGDLERPQEALGSYDKALALEPDHAEAHNNRGNALRGLRRSAEALASYDKALAVRSDYVEALANRGSALRDLDRSDEALASFDRALAVKPDLAAVHQNKGILLAELGRFSEANVALETAIELAPADVRSYFNLTLSKRLTPDDPHFKAMEELARDMPSLAEHEQIDLHFALGKALSDMGAYERSFRHLLAGKALRRRQTAYDEAAMLELFERTQASFTSELMRDNKGLGEPSPVPLFILGMPRSGTTLIEQILASHPEVHAAGEIDDLRDAIGGFRDAAGNAAHFPEATSRASAELLRQFGASYVGRLTRLAPEARRITNKMPQNYFFVGLINMALPNARIIHVRRDPMDTCLSCFSQPFVHGLPYVNDLGELGRYYRAYDALMAHWRAALPQNAMLEVQYEDVVADLEGQARRIVAHCGLEWNACCLDFHVTERAVRTASLTQVRQRIYTSSVGRWRAYEPLLGPLLAEFRPPVASEIINRTDDALAA